VSRRLAALALAVSAGLLASACAVGPRYRRPSAPVPARYKEAPAAPSAPEGWKPAEPRDAAPRGKWWEVFGDSPLNDLEEQVNVSNLQLAQAEAQYRAARAVARGARSNLFPTVSVSASASRSRVGGNRQNAAIGSTVSEYRLGGDFSWEADLWGRIRRSVEANVESARATAADLENVRLSMQAEVASDYFQLRGTDAQIQLLESTVAAYERALQLTIDRYNQGVVSGVDVAQARTQLETTRAQATDLTLTRAQLEHAIATLIGKPPADVTIPPIALEAPRPPLPEAVPAELLERRPDIAAAERRVASANAQVGVATAGFFPSLLLSASGGVDSAKLARYFSTPNVFWSIGATLAETIFDAGKRHAVREQAFAGYEGAVAAYRQTVLGAFQEVEDDLAAVRILGAEASQQTEATAAAERSLSLAESRYRGGITTYLEVVTAQSTALANERTAVEVRTRQILASVDLVKALGGGWSESQLPTPGGVLSRAEPAAAATGSSSNPPRR